MAKLAIDGGTATFSGDFPAWPVYDHREEAALLEVLHSGRWGIDGEHVPHFEQEFAEFQGAEYAIAVPNGTCALELAYEALGIGPGDEVITSPYTFVATATAILQAGAVPVFVDIDPESYTLDPAKIEVAITPRTKAICPVHIAGRPADMDTVMVIARRHNLRVVEDACQAWGARWRGRSVGTIGDLGAFSFQSSKNISAGEGGALLTNNAELAERCWSIHNVGRVREGAWYQHEILGRNLRLTEFQAALLSVQLSRLPVQMQRREAGAQYLLEIFTSVEGLDPLPDDPAVTTHARHLFMLRYDPAAFGGRSRDEFLAAWQAEGIKPASAGYVPLNQSPAVVNTLQERFGTSATPAPCPVAENLAANTIWLPQHVPLADFAVLDLLVTAALKIQQAWA